MQVNHSVVFVPSGRGKAQCQSDPEYPDGINVSVAEPGEPSCTVALPYPAPECGHFLVKCNLCGFTMAITCAGRPDDPKSVTIPCDKGAICKTGSMQN